MTPGGTGPTPDDVPCGYLALHDDGTVVDANAGLLALVGRGRGEVVGAPFAALLAPGGALFCQTHLFPLLRLQGRAEEVYLPLRGAADADADGAGVEAVVPVLLHAVRRAGAGAAEPALTHCALTPFRQRSRYEDEILRAKKGLEEAQAALQREVEVRRRAERNLQDANRQLGRISMRDRAALATLQESLLPTVPPGRVPGFEVRAFHRALLTEEEAEVGGDFYDVFPLRGGRWAMTVGDVAGKGLAAALSIAETKFALRGFLRETDGDLGDALSRLNRFVLDSNRLEARPLPTLVALAAVVADPGAGTLEVASAGSEPPLLVRAAAGTASPLPEGGMILGAAEGAAAVDDGREYPVTTVALAPGDLLALTTDGLAEARDGGRLFGAEGIGRALLRRRGSPLQDVAAAVVEEARAFAAGGALQDDVCLLLARFEGRECGGGPDAS